MTTRSWLIAMLATVAVVAVGCSYPEEKPAETNPEGEKPAGVEGKTPSTTGKKDEVTVDPRIKIKDVKVGEKRTVTSGDLVYVLYTGTLLDGKKFDSNEESGKPPFSFIVGAGSVIKGWDQGLLGMKVGGVRELEIPPDLAYGDQATSSIPANSTLKFKVTVLEIIKPEDRNSYELTTVKAGTGPKVKKGDTISLDYTGKLVNGMQFDTSEGKQPLTFEVGKGTVVPGFDLGVINTQAGGEYKLWIGPDAAYGPQESGPIPGNSVLIFDIKVRSVTPGKGEN